MLVPPVLREEVARVDELEAVPCGEGLGGGAVQEGVALGGGDVGGESLLRLSLPLPLP